MVPKDALDRKGQVSVLLRTNFRSFKHQWLAGSLIDRSRGLRGGLRITHIKTYTNKDYSRNGTCKDGWRLVLLQGCPAFMASLEKFGVDHRFPLGSGAVIIRGGTNRPKGQERPSGSRQETAGRAADRERQQQHQQQSQSNTSQQQTSHNTSRSSAHPGRNRNRSRSYSTDFPPNGEGSTGWSATGRGRGRGGPPPSAWGSAPPGGQGAPL